MPVRPERRRMMRPKGLIGAGDGGRVERMDPDPDLGKDARPGFGSMHVTITFIGANATCVRT